MDKTIFLIRHGETDSRACCIFQSNKTNINKIGKENAVKAANTLKSYGIKTIISSPFLRAKQTAKIIDSIKFCR